MKQRLILQEEFRMARMHSRKKGKSGSSRPEATVPSWAPYKEKEVEKLVLKYAKAGNTTSQIGMILRDSYGISSVKTLTNKTITELMTDNKMASKLPEDMLNLIKKTIAVKQHLEKNRQDKTAGRGLLLTTSKIRRLVKYYQKSGRLDKNWKLDMSRLKMYLE
jgi:small subunit ribosomal protein S15